MTKIVHIHFLVLLSLIYYCTLFQKSCIKL